MKALVRSRKTQQFLSTMAATLTAERLSTLTPERLSTTTHSPNLSYMACHTLFQVIMKIISFGLFFNGRQSYLRRYVCNDCALPLLPILSRMCWQCCFCHLHLARCCFQYTGLNLDGACLMFRGSTCSVCASFCDKHHTALEGCVLIAYKMKQSSSCAAVLFHSICSENTVAAFALAFVIIITLHLRAVSS